MPTRDEIDFLKSTLTRHGEIQISAAVALDLFAQVRREVDLREALQTIASEPVNAQSIAEKVLRGTQARSGVRAIAKLG